MLTCMYVTKYRIWRVEINYRPLFMQNKLHQGIVTSRYCYIKVLLHQQRISPWFVSNAPTKFPAPPAAPRTPSATFLTPRQQFTITWNEPPLNMGGTIHSYFVNISGPNDLCGTGNTPQNVTERSYTCTIQTPPQEGDIYTIRVAAANCGGRLRGPESEPAIIQGT